MKMVLLFCYANVPHSMLVKSEEAKMYLAGRFRLVEMPLRLPEPQ